MLVLLAATAQGCAAPSLYSDPAGKSGAYSRIVIANASTQLLSVRLYEDSLSCSKPVSLAADQHAFAIGEVKAIYAKKGKPFTIGAWYVTPWAPAVNGMTRRQCDLNATFVPRADQYWLTYQADDAARTCGIRAEMERAGKREAVPGATLLMRPFHVAFLQDGPWCGALNDEQLKALGRQE